MDHLQSAASPAAGHRGAHRPNAASRAAAAVSRLSTAVNLRPILRLPALALGPSAPSSAAAIPVVTSTNQAGYLVGGNGYQFRFVQGTITPPTTECTDRNGHNNYRNSGVQLIGAPGASAAVGLECINVVGRPLYFAGWAQGYSGNTFPGLTHLITSVTAGDAAQVVLRHDLSAGPQFLRHPPALPV